MKYCIKCGAQVKEEQAYCSRCGAPLNYGGKSDSETEATSQNVPGGQENNAAVSSGTDGAQAPAAYIYSNKNYNALPFDHAARAKNSHGYAVTSLVIGIISFLVCCCCPFEQIITYAISVFCLGVPALIFGISALKKGAHAGDKTMAVVGIILSCLTLLGGVITVILFATGMVDKISDYLSRYFITP